MFLLGPGTSSHVMLCILLHNLFVENTSPIALNCFLTWCQYTKQVSPSSSPTCHRFPQYIWPSVLNIFFVGLCLLNLAQRWFFAELWLWWGEVCRGWRWSTAKRTSFSIAVLPPHSRGLPWVCLPPAAGATFLNISLAARDNSCRGFITGLSWN